MHASVRASSRPRTFADRVAAVGDRWRALAGSEFLVVAESARYRAAQRRRTVTAARLGFLVIAAAAAFDGLVLIDRDPATGPILLGLNGAVAVLALGGWWLLGDLLRRHPDPVAAAVTFAMAIATAWTGMILPALAVESAGYLLLFPVLVTLILPWSTRTHLRWLGGYAGVAMAFLFSGSTSLDVDERSDLVVVMLIAIGASFAGHVLLQLAAIRNFSQVRRIERLRRRADTDRNELARVHRALEETARTDPLTGARNRLRLAEDLRTMRGRIHRVGQPHGLIAFDLDRFKWINDALGHLAGDEALKAVVTAVRATLRAEDDVYRFGGEEFIALVRADDADDMGSAAERIRTAVEELRIPHPGNGPFGVVTISVGAVLVGRDDLGATDDDWFGRADASLYEAKRAGRNRVVSSA
jgi:diguanylate cyclase (GGDEF)-like protein